MKQSCSVACNCFASYCWAVRFAAGPVVGVYTIICLCFTTSCSTVAKGTEQGKVIERVVLCKVLLGRKRGSQNKQRI